MGNRKSRILYPGISGSGKGTTISTTPDPPRLNAMSLASGASLVAPGVWGGEQATIEIFSASEGRGALKQGGRGGNWENVGVSLGNRKGSLINYRL